MLVVHRLRVHLGVVVVSRHDLRISIRIVAGVELRSALDEAKVGRAIVRENVVSYNCGDLCVEKDEKTYPDRPWLASSRSCTIPDQLQPELR